MAYVMGMDYDKLSPHEDVKAYQIMLEIPREEVTLYELEHPRYSREEDFGRIMGVWEQERARWSRMWKEILPKPKRMRVGRPREKAGPVAPKRKFDCYVQLGLPASTVAAIASVQGELALDECIRQLLAHALGPLAQPRANEKKIHGEET